MVIATCDRHVPAPIVENINVAYCNNREGKTETTKLYWTKKELK